MRIFLVVAAVFALAVSARAAKSNFDGVVEEASFNAATLLFQETGRDQLAVVKAFDDFIVQFPYSPRITDANFLIGEAHMRRALSILKDEAAAKQSSSGLPASQNPAVISALQDARKAYQAVRGDRKTGLGASAQYRLGEVAYNEKAWRKAVEEMEEVARRYPKAYINPEVLLGITYADLALEEFSSAEEKLFILGENFPTFLKEPVVLYAQGIVALHKGDYVGAERALKQVKTAEAQYYLGKTYLISKRAYLAAATFENLIRDYQDAELKEEAQFFIGDSFFLAEDYDGAIAKYQAFIAQYPESSLRVSVIFRIGASYFQKKDYLQARATFQAVLDRYPKDFFAALAQFFSAESYLVTGQIREAIAAYIRVIAEYPEVVKVAPLAYFKLAWCQNQAGSFAQAIETSSNFVAAYPNHLLAKNVHLVLANSQIALKRYVEATASLQRIIDIDPSSDIAEQALFSILKNEYDQKAFSSILTSYQFIFRHMPASKSKWRSLSYLYAADSYLALNQADEAAVIYGMLLKVYPDTPVALYAQDGLAWSYSYKGEDALALEARQKLKEMMAVAASSASFVGLNEFGIADALFNQKNYEDAYQIYEKFARENPNAVEAPSALYRAAMSSYRQGFYTQSIDLWKKLVAVYPTAKDVPSARAQIADTLFRAQKYKEAITAYREIISIEPKGAGAPAAHLRVVQAAYSANDDLAAIKQVQELILAFPAAPEANDGLDILESVFDRSRGLDFKTSLRQIVASQPSTLVGGEAQFRLARRSFDEKDWASAAADFQKFSVDFTNHPQLFKAQLYLGESFFSQSRWAESIPAYERLLGNFEKSEDTPLAVFHLASAYFNLEKLEEATRYYLRLLEEYPASPYVSPAQFNLAFTHKKLGKLELAQSAYQKYVAAAKPEDALAQNALWEIYQIQRDRTDFEGAIATLEQIRNGAKGDGELELEALYRISEVNIAAGRPDQAQITWEKMRTLTPLNSAFRLQALVKLGEAYEKTGALSSAADVYEDYSRVAPTKEFAQKAAAHAALLRKPSRGEAPVVVPERGGATEAPSAEASTQRAAPKKTSKSRTKARLKGATPVIAGSKEKNFPGMPVTKDIQ